MAQRSLTVRGVNGLKLATRFVVKSRAGSLSLDRNRMIGWLTLMLCRNTS